jgi:hypothetical protein
VSEAEAEDIAQHGFRQALSGQSYEDKLFAASAEEAARFGRINYTLDGLPFSIVEVNVPKSFAESLYNGRADSMPFRAVDPCQLGTLNSFGNVTIWDNVPITEKP